MAKEEWDKALKIAAKFHELGDQKDAIMQAHQAITNERFYRQIGKDPDKAIEGGIEALKDRYPDYLDYGDVIKGKAAKRKEIIKKKEATRNAYPPQTLPHIIRPTMAHFFDNAQDTLRDYLSTWKDKYPSTSLMFTTEKGKIRFFFADLDSSRRSPESKWFSEDEVWRLDVDLDKVDDKAERILKELYPERDFRLVKG